MSIGMKLFLFFLGWLAGIVLVLFIMFALVGPCPKGDAGVENARTIGILWFMVLFVGPVVILAKRRPDPIRTRPPTKKSDAP